MKCIELPHFSPCAPPQTAHIHTTLGQIKIPNMTFIKNGAHIWSSFRRGNAAMYWQFCCLWCCYFYFKYLGVERLERQLIRDLFTRKDFICPNRALCVLCAFLWGIESALPRQRGRQCAFNIPTTFLKRSHLVIYLHSLMLFCLHLSPKNWIYRNHAYLKSKHKSFESNLCESSWVIANGPFNDHNIAFEYLRLH